MKNGVIPYSFYLCYGVEQELEDKDKHPINSNDKHVFIRSNMEGGIFPDYDVCNFVSEGWLINHPHMLKIHPSTAQGDTDFLEYGHIRALQQCLYLNCGKVSGIFRHGIQCKVRAYGGCILCKKMWHLIQVHARACKESMCHVMRCRDLKEHLKRLQEESDTRRRASVMEMIRKQAPETVLNKRSPLHSRGCAG
ncbi:hypothetical protein MKX03_019056 [Papaver bracteatum]|nr:hypothetical protein MKX03_019056 [Papaver bracteatum]